MAHLPPKILAAFDPSTQARTLFLPSPGKRGFLVLRTRRSYTAKPIRFTGSAAALSWCETRRVNLVYYFQPLAELQ